MSTDSGPDSHDGPKINGSAAGTAFYALIIVLSLVTIVAFAAALYLLLEEREHQRAAGRHMHRSVEDEAVKDQPTTRWYHRIFGMRSNGNKGRLRDGPSRRGQGWIQAGTTDEWESDSGEDFKSNALSSPTKERNPYRTSAMYSLPRRSLVYSFISDRSSVLPSDLPVLPYEDPHAPSIRHSVPSICSQLLPSSSGPISHPAHQPNWSISTVQSATPVRISTSAPMPSSPVSIEHASSDLSHNASDLAEMVVAQKPSLRTFEGGTKFIEAL